MTWLSLFDNSTLLNCLSLRAWDGILFSYPRLSDTIEICIYMIDAATPMCAQHIILAIEIPIRDAVCVVNTGELYSRQVQRRKNGPWLIDDRSQEGFFSQARQSRQLRQPCQGKFPALGKVAGHAADRLERDGPIPAEGSLGRSWCWCLGLCFSAFGVRRIGILHQATYSKGGWPSVIVK